jgi:hypothetical protein
MAIYEIEKLKFLKLGNESIFLFNMRAVWCGFSFRRKRIDVGPSGVRSSIAPHESLPG